MIILGINDTHDASACLVKDGKLIIAVEGKGGKKNTFLEGVFMQAENKNKNGRIYTREVLTSAVDRFVNEQVITGRAVGISNNTDKFCPHD